jgi:two-component system sensor histidine kinase KdpD
MSVAGLAMAYLLATMAAAALLPRGPAALAAVLCVSALNYFFVPPRHSFEIDGAEYWWTLLVLLGVSLAVGSLLATLRERRAAAELGEARAAQLHALAEALAGCADGAAMARAGARFVHQATGHACAVFVRDVPEGPASAWCHPAGTTADAEAAAWALANGRPLGRGCDDWPDLRLWCAPFSRRRPLGALQLQLPLAPLPEAGVLQHWEALARQLGLAIERERAGTTAAAAREAAQAEAARNLLLASLSHDLRTPLAGIVGSASTLRMQSNALPEAERQRLLASLEDEARDLTQMADDVLQMARLAQPHTQLRRQVESLDDVVGASVTRTRRRWPGARVEVRHASGLPLVEVEAGLLAQVLGNLLDNAVRHGGDAGRVLVTTGSSRLGVFVAVRDHGPGQPEAALKGLFEAWRGGADRRPGAAGLGLAISRLVVEAHGGTIAAQRAEPGLEVRIDLPAALPSEAGDG